MSDEFNVPATPMAWAVRTPVLADASAVAPANVAILVPVTLFAVRIDRIRVCQVKQTTATGLLHFFLADATPTYHRHGSYAYGTGAVSTTLIPQPKEFTFDSLEIPAGWALHVTNTVASSVDAAGFEVLAFGGRY